MAVGRRRINAGENLTLPLREGRKRPLALLRLACGSLRTALSIGKRWRGGEEKEGSQGCPVLLRLRSGRTGRERGKEKEWRGWFVRSRTALRQEQDERGVGVGDLTLPLREGRKRPLAFSPIGSEGWGTSPFRCAKGASAPGLFSNGERGVGNLTPFPLSIGKRWRGGKEKEGSRAAPFSFDSAQDERGRRGGRRKSGEDGSFALGQPFDRAEGRRRANGSPAVRAFPGGRGKRGAS